MGRRRGRRSPFEINFYANTSEGPWGDSTVAGIVAGVLLTLLFVGGILVWIYLFSLDGSVSRKILFTELAVNAVLLGINIFLICRVGYDGFFKNLLCTWGANLVLTVAGFYIAQIHLLAAPEDGEVLHGVLEFIIFVLLSALMAVIPALVICGVMWVIMAVFGND